MTCKETRRALLEAPPDALADGADGALAEHLAGCPQCRGVAQRFHEAHVALLAGRERLAPPRTADEALDTLFETTADVADAPAHATDRLPARRGRHALWRRRSLQLGSMLALLAVVAAAILFRPPPVPTFDPPARSASSEVVVGDGQHAAIFHTRQPGITIVWIYNDDRTHP